MFLNPDQLFDDLMSQFETIHKEVSDEAREIENCFSVCMTSIRKLMEWHLELPVHDKRDRVHFYREILPRFFAESEYLKKRYHALQFKPAHVDGLQQFWEHELSKLNQFYYDNSPFIEYMESDRSDWDKYYFGNESAGSHAELLARWLASKKYELMVRQELRKWK